MYKAMTWIFWIFLFAYLVALGLLAIGTFGLFGQPRDPLSGVFLIPLGLPWGLAGDGPWIAILAPLLNLVALGCLKRWAARRAVGANVG